MRTWKPATDADAAARVKNMMIGAWFVMHMLITSLSGGLRGACGEWRCLRNRLWRRANG